MRVKRHIEISLIDVDRYALGPKSFVFARAMMYPDDCFPPIRVARQSNGRYRILDGRHRLTAAKLIGLKTIWASFSTKPEKR